MSDNETDEKLFTMPSYVKTPIISSILEFQENGWMSAEEWINSVIGSGEDALFELAKKIVDGYDATRESLQLYMGTFCAETDNDSPVALAAFDSFKHNYEIYTTRWERTTAPIDGDRDREKREAAMEDIAQRVQEFAKGWVTEIKIAKALTEGKLNHELYTELTKKREKEDEDEEEPPSKARKE